MADMRHRDGKVKVMHTIIGDYGRVLRQIAELDEVESILTGTIAPSKSYKESLTFQYFTDNGLKLLAKTTTAVQEIFIVTSTPDLLLDELQKMGYVDAQRDDVKHGAHGRKPQRRSGSQRDGTARALDQPHAPGGKKKHGAKESAAGVSEADPLTLRQRLNDDAIAALMRVKEEATPKVRPDSPARAEPPQRPLPTKKRKVEDTSTPEDFAALLTPTDEEESFAELFNKSKLDPKFFK